MDLDYLSDYGGTSLCASITGLAGWQRNVEMRTRGAMEPPKVEGGMSR